MQTINFSPRKIVRWDNGRTVHLNITPKPFGKERAEEIYASRSPWQGCVTKQMTLEEEAYVMAVWDTIPSGSSCFMSAFFEILNGRV
jgi:hypothetical protein